MCVREKSCAHCTKICVDQGALLPGLFHSKDAKTMNERLDNIVELLQSRIRVSFNPIITEKQYWSNAELNLKHSSWKISPRRTKHYLRWDLIKTSIVSRRLSTTTKNHCLVLDVHNVQKILMSCNAKMNLMQEGKKTGSKNITANL